MSKYFSWHVDFNISLYVYPKLGFLRCKKQTNLNMSEVPVWIKEKLWAGICDPQTLEARKGNEQYKWKVADDIWAQTS